MFSNVYDDDERARAYAKLEFPGTYYLGIWAFAFDNIPGVEHRAEILRGLRRLLHDNGRIILLDWTLDIYVNEWASFTTRDFPENRHARSGDEVRAVMKDVDDRRPVVDLFWFHDDYLALFAASDLELIAHHAPLGRDDEPYAWVTERSISPWAIYVLKSLFSHPVASGSAGSAPHSTIEPS
jgi:hypothetical protein